jgi:hypothetical protein
VKRWQRKVWFWSHDSAPIWFAAYVTPYLWRPLCWARGWHEPHHCDVYFELCVLCSTSLWSRKRNGSPNTVMYARFVPSGWRRLLGHPAIPLAMHDDATATA